MRRFRTCLAILTFVLCAVPSAAWAKGPGPMEIEAVAGTGGPVLLIGASYPGGVTTASVTDFVAVRVGIPDYTPLRLELNTVVPCGVGANLIIDVMNFNGVRIHLLDPGIFWNVIQPVSAARLPRPIDITLGAGADVKVSEHWSVGLNWRWFIPNPITVIPDYADFSYPEYREAMRGGQLWFVPSYTF